jgi:hypothetical protein
MYESFRTGVDRVPSLIPMLFDVKGSTKATEQAVAVGSVPIDQWDLYEDKGQVAHVDVDQGYPTTFTHVEKPVRFNVLKKHIDDENIDAVNDTMISIGISAAQRREYDAASVFNNAFDDNFAGPDALGLCSTAHPYGPDNTGQTHGNEGTTAFAYTAITSTRVLMRQFVDSQGLPNPRIGSLALIPEDLENTAIEIFDATNKPGTADNDASAARGINYQVWEYLTDANNWFLLDTTWTRQFLRWYNRKPLEMMQIDETTTYITYEFYMRYSYGWTDWRWLYGHQVS